jgi:hypothetical protein
MCLLLLLLLLLPLPPLPYVLGLMPMMFSSLYQQACGGTAIVSGNTMCRAGVAGNKQTDAKLQGPSCTAGA